jgi:hypothetical protein
MGGAFFLSAVGLVFLRRACGKNEYTRNAVGRVGFDFVVGVC